MPIYWKEYLSEYLCLGRNTCVMVMIVRFDPEYLVRQMRNAIL